MERRQSIKIFFCFHVVKIHRYRNRCHDSCRNWISSGQTNSAAAAGGRGYLEALKLLVRRQVRVRVVEADREADQHVVRLHVVQKRAAVGVGLQRPAERVHDEAGLELGRVDLPHLARVGVRAWAWAWAWGPKRR